MDKDLKDAILALPQMKERLNRLYAYSGEKYEISSDNISISLRLSTKTIANNQEDTTSMDLNNKLKELIEKPLS